MFLKSKNDICFIILAKKWSKEKLPWFIMLLRLHSDVDDIREGNLYVTCLKGFAAPLFVVQKKLDLEARGKNFSFEKNQYGSIGSTIPLKSQKELLPNIFCR